METRLARLKPFDPRQGQTLRRYTFEGIRFRADRGWCRVELRVAQHLSQVQSRPGDPRSPQAFDVCTDEEARALEEKEKREQATRKAATDEPPLTHT